MSHSISRSKDWDDLLTCHEGSAQGRTWSVQNKRIGKHSFSLIEKKSFQLDPPDEIAKCVCVSACGNYGLVGTQGSGKVGLWNMQSGMKRRVFILPGSSGKGKQNGMVLNVVGIATDALNQLVIVATRSGHIHVRPIFLALIFK
jgi:U3 small nucleolar RNA-associated protein 21